LPNGCEPTFVRARIRQLEARARLRDRSLRGLIRCAIVASGMRNALAISAVVRPPTARRVRAICDGGDSASWQHRNSSPSESS